MQAKANNRASRAYHIAAHCNGLGRPVNLGSGNERPELAVVETDGSEAFFLPFAPLRGRCGVGND